MSGTCKRAKKIPCVNAKRRLHIQSNSGNGRNENKQATVPHFVDKDTKFCAATFTNGENSENIWEAFLYFWVAPYIGYPDYAVLDQYTSVSVIRIP